MKYKDFLRIMKRAYKRMSKKERKRYIQTWTLDEVMWNLHGLCGYNLFS